MNQSEKGIYAGWFLILLVNFALWGVIIWAIIKLVNYFTGG